jgi:predicted dehydrogenase
MITTAVIGVGRMGSYHAQIYQKLSNVKLVGLADINPGAAKLASERFGGKVYLDYREMLEVEHPQAVSVAVPAFLHEEIAVAALESNAHVIVEKPIALTPESGMRIVECARQHQRKLIVGYIERFNPVVQRLKTELQTNQLGKIYQIICRRASPFPDRIHDVGVVIDLALHDLDLLHFLLDQLPIRLYAEVHRHLQGTLEDSLLGLLYYKEGMTGLLDINWLSPVKVREVLVYAEKGLFHANTLTQKLTHYPNNQQPINLQVHQHNPLELELQEFLRAIKGEATSAASGYESLSSLYLAFELLESGKNQEVRHVSYDLAA